MSDKFCKALTNAVSFRIPGDSGELTFNPCCLYDDYIKFHRPVFNRMRQKFIETKTFLPGCSKCELKEKTHGMSLRTVTNRDIPDGIGNEIYKLEIVLDTTCNAACIQCGDTQSSLWRKEKADDKKIFHIQPEDQIDKKIEDIAKIVDLSKVRFVHFWGGEPLLTDTHLKVINLLSDYKNIELSYTTNGSIFPKDDVLKIWEKFKRVKIALSIDGTEDKFHYIRWPLSWDKIKRNLELFKTESPRNSHFHINCCIIPLNVFYINELGGWLKENFDKNFDGTTIGYNFIRGEGMLDIACTPLALREKILKNLSVDHPIYNVLNEVPVNDYTEMVNYLDYWDIKRKLNWRETFKEIAPYFTN